MAEYFWIQKNDNEGKTIALENRCRVSGESVAEKLHEMDLTKGKLIAQNQMFSLSKFVGKVQSINILLKGIIREKDEVGRNIPFTLVKEFRPTDNYKNYICNLSMEMEDVLESAGLEKNAIDGRALDEVCLIAQSTDESQCAFGFDGFFRNVKKNPKVWIVGGIILVILLAILFK